MRTLLSIIFIFVTHAALAQWYIGGRSGITLSDYKSKTNLKEVMNKGVAVGLSAYRLIGQRAGIHVGFDYVEKGYQHHVCSTISDRLETTFLEAPIMFDYSFPMFHNFRFHARGGTYVAFWLTAHYKSEGYDEPSVDFDFQQNQAKRIDYGTNLGVLIDYTLNNSKLGLELKYSVGLRDMQALTGDNTSNVNRTWLIGIAYMLPLTK